VHSQGTYSALVYRQPHPWVCGNMSWLARSARQPAHIPTYPGVGAIPTRSSGKALEPQGSAEILDKPSLPCYASAIRRQLSRSAAHLITDPGIPTTVWKQV